MHVVLSGPVSEIHFPSGLRSPSSGPSSSLFDISLCLSCAVSLLRSVWGVASFVQVLCDVCSWPCASRLFSRMGMACFPQWSHWVISVFDMVVFWRDFCVVCFFVCGHLVLVFGVSGQLTVGLWACS